MRRRFFIKRRVRFLRHFQRIFDELFLNLEASPMMNCGRSKQTRERGGRAAEVGSVSAKFERRTAPPTIDSAAASRRR